MDIEDFNRLPAADAARLLRTCVDIDAWVEGLVRRRPYPDLATVLRAAGQLAEDWDRADVEKALADHPRIGERPTGDSPGAELSRSEQAGVPEDDDVRDRLAAGNRRYEERFGRIYLVRAKGRTAEEMLDLLEQRLRNDPDTELGVTAQQLREIALLRLEGLLS